MKISLDELIRKNTETFDKSVPPNGHFERFEDRLSTMRRKRMLHRKSWIALLSVAASLSLILLMNNLHLFSSVNAQEESITEVVHFYHSQLNQEIEKIEGQLCLVDIQDRQKIGQDLERIRKENPEWNDPALKIADEDRITLIVLYYNAQLESLQNLQLILKETSHNQEHKL